MKPVFTYGVLVIIAGALVIFFGAESSASAYQTESSSQEGPATATILAQSSQGQTPSDRRGGGDSGYGYQRPYSPRYTDPYRYRSPAYRRGYQYGYREERGADDPAQRRDYRNEYGSRYRDENRYYGSRYRSYEGRYYGPRGPYGSRWGRIPGTGVFPRTGEP